MSESPIASPSFELRRAVACLAVEVPGEVWDDVNAKAEAVLERLERLEKLAESGGTNEDPPGGVMDEDEYADSKFEVVKGGIKELAGAAANRANAEKVEVAAIEALVALVDHYEGALQAEFVRKTKAESRLALAEGVLRSYGHDEEYEDALSSQGVLACRSCGQTDQGQTGEYPCGECGLPRTWDVSAKAKDAETVA